MAHDSTAKKVASYGAYTGKARVFTQKNFSGTAEKKIRLSEHPKPQYLAHSESSDPGEINVKLTDVTEAGLEKKELFYRRIIAPLFPALLCAYFVLGRPDSSDPLVHYVWAFFGFLYIYGLSIVSNKIAMD